MVRPGLHLADVERLLQVAGELPHRRGRRPGVLGDLLEQAAEAVDAAPDQLAGEGVGLVRVWDRLPGGPEPVEHGVRLEPADVLLARVPVVTPVDEVDGHRARLRAGKSSLGVLCEVIPCAAATATTFSPVRGSAMPCPAHPVHRPGHHQLPGGGVRRRPRSRSLGTAQQEIEQHYPQDGWVEHEPEDIWYSVARTVREALATAGRDAGDVAADRHHQPARDGGRVGPRHRPRRSTGRSSGRTAAPPTSAAHTPPTSRGSPRRPGWSSTRTSPARSCAGCSRHAPTLKAGRGARRRWRSARSTRS